MNRTGHYEYVPSRGWVKMGEEIPTLKRPVFFNKGNVPEYDPSARETFQSKDHKRQWLKDNHLREGGRITSPDRRWDGPTRNGTKPTMAQRAARKRSQEWIRAHGGAERLLTQWEQGRIR